MPRTILVVEDGMEIRNRRAVEALRSCSVEDENPVFRWNAPFGPDRIRERKCA